MPAGLSALTISKSRRKNGSVTNKIILTIVIAIFVMLVLVFLLIANSNVVSRYAEFINEAGRIRGGIQRATKNAVLGPEAQTTRFIFDVEESFRTIEEPSDLPFSRHLSIFSDHYYTLVREWEALKPVLLMADSPERRDLLLDMSEIIWMTADSFVDSIEKRTQELISQFYAITLFAMGIILLLTIALIISKVILKDRVEYRANHDQLTGLFNRHHFEETLAARFLSAKRAGKLLAVIVCDIDHFKEINDKFGHDTGDQVIKWIANSILRQCRHFDSVTRFGGEEFVILTEVSREGDAKAHAERIRAEIANHTPRGLVPLTASLGVATSQTGTNVEEIFKNADLALYTAKNAGRNRTVLFREGGVVAGPGAGEGALVEDDAGSTDGTNSAGLADSPAIGDSTGT